MIWSEKKESPAFGLVFAADARVPSTSSRERAMSIGLYPGGRSNRSPSPEAKPDLDGTTLMLALLALNTPDLSTDVSLLRLREGDYRDGGSGDAGLEWLSMTSNRGTGGFVNNGVRGTGSEHECIPKVAHGYRIALEKTVNVATRGSFNSVAWTKKAHETQATTMILNALRISRTYTPSVAPPCDYRVASEMCRRAAASGVLVERELEEGGPLKILPPGTRRKDSHPPGKHPMANARHIRPLLTFVASSMAITSKKSNELRGMRICRGLLKPSRQRGSKMWG
ncbi:hypothetical protein H4582DRAFT_2133980 [Lactarius indigo]|nr:hypothetical protein H4582DRAFT_2133980 [Lactarius indigo]